MNNNQRFLFMLSNLPIEISDEIKDGELLGYELAKDNKTWRIKLLFDHVLELSYLKNLLNIIEQYMIKNLNATSCRFTISVRNEEVNDAYIEDYFNDGIDVLSSVRKDILILKRYQLVIHNHGLKIIVPNEMEKAIVANELVNLRKYFKNYGMEHLKIEINNEDTGIDFKKSHEKELEVVERLNQAESRENYNKLKLEEMTKTNNVEYKARYNKDAYPVNVSEFPLNSMGVQEFKQINGTDKVRTSGVIVKAEGRKLKAKSGKEYNIFTGLLTDYNDTIMFKRFYKDEEKSFFEKELKPGLRVNVVGTMQWDDFGRSVSVMCDSIKVVGPDTSRIRFDGQEEKRVELHAHTKMSVLDSILNVEEYVAQAKAYGHKALAVTDHENCHVLPEFFKCAKKEGLKPIAGVEASYVDTDSIKIALTTEDIKLDDATFVIFDIETTGFAINFNEIIEIGAVKVQNGMIIDSFSSFVKPKKKISDYIAELTDISNDTVYDALPIEEVLPSFKQFIEGCILVAHNAKFDTDFIYEKMRNLNIFDHPYPCIDTIQIARSLYPNEGLKRFNLGAVAKFLKVEVEKQHRAIHDARTTTNVFMKMLGDIKQLKVDNYQDLNTLVSQDIYKYVFPTHLNILVKNKVGLKNMYKLISDSHTTHYAKGARLVKDVLIQHREGLLIGSGCVNGDVFRAALEKTEDILREHIKFFDYIEVQPPKSYLYLFEHTKDEGALEYIIDCIKLIIRVAKEEGKIVVATGDVHELISEDTKYRKIYLAVARPNGGGRHELDGYENIPDLHFRTTSEMLNEFNFLPADLAYEIVVTNTNLINDLIEDYPLFPKKLFIPRDDFRKDYGVPSMEKAIYELCDQTAKEMYGENIPEYVKKRVDRELEAIIGHGYFSVYYISHLLVKNSNDNGYVVGSRGSVGSSIVATLMKITEVNAFAPHYVCPHCHYSAFKLTEEEKSLYNQQDVPPHIEEALQSINNGYDLPPMACPKCNTMMNRDGMNIAFETFLGFTGEKCPDIDLNFSGDYQAKAHLFTQEIFGKEYAFRAGTISTVMDKTAFAYVRDYYNAHNIEKRQAELERLAVFIAGSKKTTGQHPGGIVVVPDDAEIYDITPVQYPPVTDKDDLSAMQWRTTHFDYHTFEANLLKLDILGHDDPTLIKKLMEYVYARPEEFPFNSVQGIPLIDEAVLSLYSSKDALNIKGDDIDRFSSGTIGLPEFGTNFVRGMLETIKPKTYNDIIKVSGLSHGTDVWSGNAESLVMGTVPNFPKVEFKDVIGCRDDIMIYLINKGVPAAISFKIMESVRKGKGINEEQIDIMRTNNVPEWFIWTCKKIKYLFPKAHAVAYVQMSLRIGWFKVHRPIYYYAVYFSVRAKELDAEIFALGKNAIRNKINEIEKKQKEHLEVTNKEENLLDELKIALEMVLRGYKFNQIDINKSAATDFVIGEDNKSLYLPFIAIESLGENVANSIVEARNQYPFTSLKDVERRTSINKTQFARLKTLGVFDNLPEDDTLNLF